MLIYICVSQGDLLHGPPFLPKSFLLDLSVLLHILSPYMELSYIIPRHEGRKMKQELRCHAVLCPKEEKARQMATCLQERLHQVDTN